MSKHERDQKISESHLIEEEDKEEKEETEDDLAQRFQEQLAIRRNYHCGY